MTLKERLTPLQYKITRLVAYAKCNKEIAETFGIAEGTVRNSLKEIYERLGWKHSSTPTTMRVRLATTFLMEEEALPTGHSQDSQANL